MAEAAKSKPEIKSVPNSTNNTSHQLRARESQELVIAFSGAIGSGVPKAVKITSQQLKDEGYEVKHIKVSDLICDQAQKLGIDANIDENNRKERYEKLQDAGNHLREKYGHDILTEFVISSISIWRKQKQIDSSDNDDTLDSASYVPPKTAYLVDQLKNPAEVDLLKIVYGNLFYLIGVLASENARKHTLVEVGLDEVEAITVMERDRKEDDDAGQQLEKTLQLADFFIRDSHSNEQILSSKINRLVKLIHGYNGITPTSDEFGMYSAYSASLKSACLSRQVGASITDDKGNIVATGCNDVPKAGGGLYIAIHNPDNRCVNKGLCSNDKYKKIISDEIKDLIAKELDLEPDSANKISEVIRTDSRLKDLLEFSRSVHAEMDAIVSVAREGGQSVKGCTLYTTTFPCHNCARHIIASGIGNVVFIEPYEKSLALNLHGDDISYDPDESDTGRNKVKFMHFEGVSPKQYISFFGLRGDRKDENGEVIKNTIIPAHKVSQEYLDNYREFEIKVLSNLNKLGLISNEELP